jgi:diacylglycerol kinase
MTNPMVRVGRPSAGMDRFPSRKSTPEERTETRRRRSPWRQRLVDAERGLAHSFRADSSLHLHLFVASLVLATSGVLGLTAVHWAVVVAGLTAILSAELAYQGLRTVAAELSQRAQKQAAAVGAAARLLVDTGSAFAIGVVLWLRFHELFGS